jgi:hypothetical protein
MRRTYILATFLTTLTLISAAQTPSPTDPPPTQQAILTLTAKGVQIYTCQQTGTTPQWVFQAPEATLFDASLAEAGTHGAGPIWKYKDGSTVKGELVANSAAPSPDAIPWLLLKAASHEGTGTLSKVEFIRRYNTSGGLAPTTGCDATHQGATSRVPYAAIYTFYSSKP